MNIFGQLVLTLIGIGAVIGIFFTMIAIILLWIIEKGARENGKH